MDWLINLIKEQTSIQALIILALICAIGLAVGKIRIFGVSLGVAFVFFIGIIAGHMGLSIDPQMMTFAQNFGLVLFIYALGVQVGPGFFASFKTGGLKLNLLALSVVCLGPALITLIWAVSDMDSAELMGLLSGAATNTPMLGAAQQAILQLDPDNADKVNNMAMACAVGYPIGIISVILCIIILQKSFTNRKSAQKKDIEDNPFLSEFVVDNPEIFGKSIKEIRQGSECQFVISRIWKNGQVIIPTSDTIIEQGEHILLISSKKDTEYIRSVFGHKENKDWNKEDIDWNAIDNQLESRKILISKSNLNGVKLGSLRLRNSLGINITRVSRAGIDLLPSPSLHLQLGDRLTIVGEKRALEAVSSILGNEARVLKTPNLFAIFTGIFLGLILGSIPIVIPGISIPLKLGIAGGPIIAGLLMGAFGPRIHISTYTTRSANLMLQQIGLTLYLACLGLSAGPGFFETVLSSNGLLWILISFLLAVIPVLLTGFISLKIFKTEYTKTIGMLCGSMCNPIALNYANSTLEGDEPSVAYATVYPITIFMRVFTAQLVILLLG